MKMISNQSHGDLDEIPTKLVPNTRCFRLSLPPISELKNTLEIRCQPAAETAFIWVSICLEFAAEMSFY